MTDRIKMAFDQIQAEDSLKEATLQHLRKKMQSDAKPRHYVNVRRLAAMTACLLLIVFAGIFSHNIYFTEVAYIDLDINPSLELSINRFDRIISASAYNTDGEELLIGLDLTHKKVNAALNEIIEATALSGILQNQGLVSVTVQSLSGDESTLLENLQTEVQMAVSHHGSAQVDVFPVDADTRIAAHELHITPAKYLAIMELQEVDPTVTIEECKDHTINEIKQLTQEHGGNHHGEGSSDQDDSGNSGSSAGIDAESHHSTNASDNMSSFANDDIESYEKSSVVDDDCNNQNSPQHHGGGNNQKGHD